MWLWNYLVPGLFHLSMVTFWQAVALALLSRLLFGSLHKGWNRWHKMSWAHSGCDCGCDSGSGSSKCNCGGDCQCGTHSHEHDHEHEHGHECGCHTHSHEGGECGCKTHEEEQPKT